MNTELSNEKLAAAAKMDIDASPEVLELTLEEMSGVAGGISYTQIQYDY
jgi:hypothetical protein